MKCPLCGTEMVPWIRYGKDTGNLICPKCWYKSTPDGQRIKAKKKVRYGGSKDWRDHLDDFHR